MNPTRRRSTRVCISFLIAGMLLTGTACEKVIQPPTVQSGPLATPTTPPTTAGPTTSVPSQSPSLPAPTSLSSKIGDYMQLGGDRIVVVPDGIYHGGVVSAPHAATNGRYGGWLILVAQHRGQVVIDMLNDPDPYNNNERGLRLQPDTTRVMFVGFSFRNGVIRNYGNSIRFWYCDHQDADYQYLADGRPTPRMFQNYWGVDNLGVYGDDFHNGVATAVFFGAGPSNVTMQGIRVYNIDPKFGDTLDPTSHIVPMGSPPGLHSNFAIRDSYLEGYYTLFGTDTGDETNLVFENIWRGFGYASPFLLQAAPGRKLVGVRRTNWQIFGPGANLSANGNDPYIYIDGNQYAGNDTYKHPDRVDIVDTNVKYGYPAGVTDPASAQGSASNPASIWRGAHPYDSWLAYFGWS